MLCWNRDSVYAVWLLPAVNLPFLSVVLTVISLGTRVLLAYVLSSDPGCRRLRNLDCDPDWLVPGGCLRDRVLLAKNEKSVEKIRKTM